MVYSFVTSISASFHMNLYFLSIVWLFVEKKRTLAVFTSFEAVGILSALETVKTKARKFSPKVTIRESLC